MGHTDRQTHRQTHTHTHREREREREREKATKLSSAFASDHVAVHARVHYERFFEQLQSLQRGVDHPCAAETRGACGDYAQPQVLVQRPSHTDPISTGSCAPMASSRSVIAAAYSAMSLRTSSLWFLCTKWVREGSAWPRFSVRRTEF